MYIIKNCLFLFVLSLLVSCAKTDVSVMDSSAVGHSNIHVVFVNDSLDDHLDVGTYFIEAFQDYGVSASREAPEQEAPSEGTGSGFVVADGYWMTNHHVIDGAKKITISVAGSVHPATVVDSDKHLDLALLKASTVGLRPFEISEAKLGQDIFAIGYPMPDILSSKARITSGLVSSLEGLEGDGNNIQISAPIQPGNSGGPVVSKDWDVVGVAVSTASTLKMATRSGTIPQGLNFAVSPNHVKGFLVQNGIQAQGPYVSSMEEAIASSGLIWSGQTETKSRKRTYLAKYSYTVLWDNLHYHIRLLTVRIVDAQTGKTIVTSRTKSPNLGVEIPVEQAAKDILKKLGLVS